MLSHPTSLYSAERTLALLRAHPNTNQLCLSAGETSGILHEATSIRQQCDKAKPECRTAGQATGQLPIAFCYFPIQRPCSTDQPTGKFPDVSLFHRCISHFSGQIPCRTSACTQRQEDERVQTERRFWFNRLTPTGAWPQSVWVCSFNHEDARNVLPACDAGKV